MPMWYEEDTNKMKESGKDMGETDPKKLVQDCVHLPDGTSLSTSLRGSLTIVTVPPPGQILAVIRGIYWPDRV